ncbi:hypothetical protein ACH5RR_030978 [Cinchona calisaya]|uniref:Uncharacterized protein n=1 Tax=Cinchona calisaya TaxID=153742 RepID=A0ABD2YDV4_9GENT
MGRRVKIARQKTRLKIPEGVFSPMNLYGSTKTRALLDNLAKTAKREKIKQILYNGSATWSSPLDLMVASSF